MQGKGIIIQGSARSNGNTSVVVQRLSGQTDFDILDLKSKNIGYYDYDHQLNDDFLPVLKEIIENYQVIILATPVYWYSMSASMKAFLDRITEGLRTQKELGRRMRGKYLGAMSCGSDDELNNGFFEPFRLSAGYLGMHYLGDVHTWIEMEISPEVETCIDQFANSIQSQIQSISQDIK